MYLDGRPLAFVYGYHHGGYLDLMRAGFHPDYAKLAPGNAPFHGLFGSLAVAPTATAVTVNGSAAVLTANGSVATSSSSSRHSRFCTR